MAKEYRYAVTFTSEGQDGSSRADDKQKTEKYYTKSAAEARFRQLQKLGRKPVLKTL